MAIELHGDVAARLDRMEAIERNRTFARDDLAPGNPAARRAQAVTLEIVRLARIGLATQGPADEPTI